MEPVRLGPLRCALPSEFLLGTPESQDTQSPVARPPGAGHMASDMGMRRKREARHQVGVHLHRLAQLSSILNLSPLCSLGVGEQNSAGPRSLVQDGETEDRRGQRAG